MVDELWIVNKKSMSKNKSEKILFQNTFNHIILVSYQTVV